MNPNAPGTEGIDGFDTSAVKLTVLVVATLMLGAAVLTAFFAVLTN